jgi:hypothetical protein
MRSLNDSGGSGCVKGSKNVFQRAGGSIWFVPLKIPFRLAKGVSCVS